MIRLLWKTLQPILPYLALGFVILLFALDPALGNIFQKPMQKAGVIKEGLMNFAKISVAIAFVICFIAALMGRVNWKWVGVLAFVAIALATFNEILVFLEVG